jgi:hypothetical protein
MDPSMKISQIYFWCIPILYIGPSLEECWDIVYLWNHSKSNPISGYVSLSHEHCPQCWMDPRMKVWQIYFWCIPRLDINPWLEEGWDMFDIWNHSKSTPIFGSVSLSQEHFPPCWMDPRMKISQMNVWCIPILYMYPWLEEGWDMLHVWNHSS